MISALLALPLWAVSAALPQQSAANFDKDLQKIHKLMDQRRWADADRQFKALLDNFKGQDVAFANRAVLIEDARRIRFWIDANVPDAKTLVSGDLQTYKAGENAKIKIVYTPGNMGDFIQRRGAVTHPAHLDGPFTVKIEGAYYPHNQPPFFNFGNWGDDEIGYQVSFGIAPDGRGTYFPGRIYEYRGDDETELDERDSIPAKASEEFTLEVKVSKSKITVKQQGKTILSAKRDRESGYGYFTIGGLQDAGVTRVELVGEVQTGWIDGLIDDALSSQVEAFDASYDPSIALPKWLFAEIDVAAEDPGADRTVPAPNPVNLHRAWKQVGLAIRKGRTAAAIDWLTDLDEDDLPESHRAYLLCQLHYQLGNMDQALEQCRLVLEEDPMFLPARLDEGHLLYRLDRENSFEVLKDVAEDFPNTLRPNKEYLTLLLLSGRDLKAKAFVNDIASNNPRSPVLDSLKAMLVKAENGPNFAKMTEYSTEHYVVQTDMDREVCIEAAKLLEQMYRGYRLHLESSPEKDRKKFRVYLFSGESNFQHYAEDVFGGGHVSAAGLYSPVLKQLLIWNLPDREEMFNTFQHEGFHQYLDRMMPDPPVWLNEGMASYFEHVEYVKGKWKEGQKDSYHVATLRKKGLMPLAQYVRLSHREFRTEEFELRNYAQGWLLTHYLRNSNRKNLELFRQIFEELCEAEDGQACVDRILADVNLSAMHKELEKHLAAM